MSGISSRSSISAGIGTQITPLLWHSQYYVTAIMFIAYAGLVVWGFVVWLRASRSERDPVLEEALA